MLHWSTRRVGIVVWDRLRRLCLWCIGPQGVSGTSFGTAFGARVYGALLQMGYRYWVFGTPLDNLYTRSTAPKVGYLILMADGRTHARTDGRTRDAAGQIVSGLCARFLRKSIDVRQAELLQYYKKPESNVAERRPTLPLHSLRLLAFEHEKPKYR